MQSKFALMGWSVGGALCLSLLTACQKAPPAPEPVRAVKLLTLGANAGSQMLEFSADVRARVESVLSFRVAGKLSTRPVELGQRVAAGAVLAQLDPLDYQAQAQAASAQLTAAQTARDVAEADYTRYQNLFAQGFISAAELERREASLKAARAQWQQAQAQQTVLGNQSQYTRLLADGAGVVTAIEAQPGQVLAAGQPVLRLALDGARDVVFAVGEDRLRDLRLGAEVSVTPWGQEKTWSARVRDVAAQADPVTRTFLIKAELAAGHGLPLGATATVRLKPTTQATASALRLPTSALRQEGGKTWVWVLDATQMTVHLQEVSLGAVQGNEVEVQSGLQPGQEVVATGVHVLTAGQKVTRYQTRP